MWTIAERRSRQRALPEGDVQLAWRELGRHKTQARAKAEHPLQLVKCQVGYMQVYFRGPAPLIASPHFAVGNQPAMPNRLRSSRRKNSPMMRR